MKNLKAILFIILFLTIFPFPKYAHADVVPPSPANNCREDEEYFREDKINPEEYENIRPVEFEHPFSRAERGYCVNRKEYCAKIKNFCGLKMMLEMINDPFLHIQNLLINFILNNIFLILLLIIDSQDIKKILQKSVISKMSLVTLIGYFWDFIFIVYVGPFFTMGLHHLTWPRSSPMHLDLRLSSIAISFVLIFIFTTLTFYFVIGKKIFQKKKLSKSILFGILSNPIWFSFSIFIDSILTIFSLLSFLLPHY